MRLVVGLPVVSAAIPEVQHLGQCRIGADRESFVNQIRAALDEPGPSLDRSETMRSESWVARLVPEATPLLRLAARCQHLERWSVPRANFPLDRPGYLAWRRSLYTKQATRALE